MLDCPPILIGHARVTSTRRTRLCYGLRLFVHMKYSRSKEISEEEAKTGFTLTDDRVVLGIGQNRIIKQQIEGDGASYLLQVKRGNLFESLARFNLLTDALNQAAIAR
jgi:hypothetical protein